VNSLSSKNELSTLASAFVLKALSLALLEELPDFAKQSSSLRFSWTELHLKDRNFSLHDLLSLSPLKISRELKSQEFSKTPFSSSVKPKGEGLELFVRSINQKVSDTVIPLIDII
jgi:hypothetical protein